mgnify:CR=1 FL=1
MFVLMKTPVTCILIMAYMIGFYYRKPHIPVRSTKIFQFLTAAAMMNAVFDLITLYTVNNRDIVPEQVNLAAHIVYLLSILSFIYLLFLYMRSYLEASVKFSGRIMVLQCLPFVISMLGIFVLPITYEQGSTTDYSLGPKAYALYASLVIYLFLILYYNLRYWQIMDADKRLAIILAVPLYAVTAVVQMLIPETLVAIICSTLILLGLILSNENTEKYMDEKTSLFNQYSFEKVLDEFDFEKQKMILAVVCFCKTENNLDWKQDDRILEDIYREARPYHMYGYHVCENGVAFLSSSEERAWAMLDRIKEIVEGRYGRESLSVETQVMSGENAASKQSCMRNTIAFCAETGSRLAFIDYLTNIYNRNALERDLSKCQETENLTYFIADLNDLKLVNDTIGHSAGDKLLQGFAGLLVDAVGKDGRAYRQGGDEFAVLYRKDAEQFYRRLERRCREYNQSCNIPVSYAIGYCRVNDGDFRDVADRMMYEHKRESKRGRA